AGHGGRGREHLLEVVDEQEQPRARKGIGQRLLGVSSRLRKLERLQDRAGDERRILQRREQRDPGPILELEGQPADELERETCLADATDAGERDEAGAVSAHKFGELGELTLAAEKR